MQQPQMQLQQHHHDNDELITTTTTTTINLNYHQTVKMSLDKNQLILPSGIIMKTTDSNEFKTFDNDENDVKNNTSENAKDLLLKQQVNNNNNNNNMNDSHCINNSNNINNKSNTESAFNCKTNSDKNYKLQKLSNNMNRTVAAATTTTTTTTETSATHNTDMINNKSLQIEMKINDNDEEMMEKIENKELSTSIKQQQQHHENAYNPRNYIEDVHNYSKKSNNNNNNNYEFNSSSDNNISTDDYDEDSDSNYMNNANNNQHFNIVASETDKWVQNIKKHSENIQQNINNTKSETPDSGLPDDDEKLTPDHHARRPMNAFLIFCKRHRGIVREKYKNVENRQITKILGEWWANMTKEEKSCYANLAKENKDAFLTAHPGFKWYKLPAPSLRTLSTRPVNGNCSASEISPIKINHDDVLAEQQSTIIIEQLNSPTNDKQKQHHKRASPIAVTTTSMSTTSILNKSQNDVGVFKFADETQMGSLNSLICGNSPTDTSSIKSLSSPSSLSPTIQSNDLLLQNTLGETSNFISTAISSDNFTLQEPFENMRDYATKMNTELNSRHESNALKRKFNHNMNNMKFLRDSSFSSSEDDNLNNRKLSRSCKGKKYQELVNSGQITVLAKKPKKQKIQTDMEKSDKNHYDNTFVQNNLKDSSSDGEYFNLIHKTQKTKPTTINLSPTTNYKIEKPTAATATTPIDKKHFDMIDFDLDAKIMALPAQCLDQYLLKKQESKTKKKFNNKRRKANSVNKFNINKNKLSNEKTIHEIKEQIVGSKKRKARKESITRRDVNNLQNDNLININLNNNYNNNTLNIVKESENDELEINVETEFSLKNKPIAENITVPSLKSSDLLILAQVASNFDENFV